MRCLRSAVLPGFALNRLRRFRPTGGCHYRKGVIMAGSEAERAIRNAVADRLRFMLPGSRIIHELVVGQCRADLAAIGKERVTLVEIKSSKDKLDRLAKQIRAFQEASHEVIVVADRCWWDDTPYNNGNPRLVPSKELGEGAGMAETWCWPEPQPGEARYGQGAWRVRSVWAQSPDPEPHAAKLLSLLWREELMRECFNHQIAAAPRTNMSNMIHGMAWNMSGKEIARAVCRQLRQRNFPEADAPIIERLAA